MSYATLNDYGQSFHSTHTDHIREEMNAKISHLERALTAAQRTIIELRADFELSRKAQHDRNEKLIKAIADINDAILYASGGPMFDEAKERYTVNEAKNIASRHTPETSQQRVFEENTTWDDGYRRCVYPSVKSPFRAFSCML